VAGNFLRNLLTQWLKLWLHLATNSLGKWAIQLKLMQPMQLVVQIFSPQINGRS